VVYDSVAPSCLSACLPVCLLPAQFVRLMKQWPASDHWPATAAHEQQAAGVSVLRRMLDSVLLDQ
jgi:hypothetical protein